MKARLAGLVTAVAILGSLPRAAAGQDTKPNTEPFSRFKIAVEDKKH
ncbi:MAG: hypothetical protein O2917_08710 [Acidobacteria bacterium]|nr:hypothetical protein [Acidobacteriota bacterium]